MKLYLHFFLEFENRKVKGKFFELVRMFRLQSCVKVMIREDFVHNHGLNHIFGIDLGILGFVFFKKKLKHHKIEINTVRMLIL